MLFVIATCLWIIQYIAWKLETVSRYKVVSLVVFPMNYVTCLLFTVTILNLAMKYTLQ